MDRSHYPTRVIRKGDPIPPPEEYFLTRRLNPDFRDMLSALSAERADFLVVGAYALGAHVLPRATQDLDIWVRATKENAERVLRAIKRFGAPMFDLTLEYLADDDTVFQIGLPPNRIDILTRISGVQFDDAWGRKLEVEIDGLNVPVLGREDLVTNSWSTSGSHRRRCPGRASPGSRRRLIGLGASPRIPRRA